MSHFLCGSLLFQLFVVVWLVAPFAHLMILVILWISQYLKMPTYMPSIILSAGEAHPRSHILIHRKGFF